MLENTNMWFICQVDCRHKVASWRIKSASSLFSCVKFYLKKHIYVYQIIPLSEYFVQKISFLKKVERKYWNHFFDKLHSLLMNGETLLTALTVLQEDRNSPQRFVEKALLNLKNGLFIGTLWDEEEVPLNKGQKYLLQCAEQGGFLTQGVKQIKDALKFQSKVKKQIRRSLIYPGCVLSVMFVFMGVLSLFLLRNVEMFFCEQNIVPGIFTKFIFTVNHCALPVFFCFLGLVFVVSIFLKVKNISLLDKFELFIEKRCRLLRYSMFSINLAEFLENNFSVVESVKISLDNFVDKNTQNNVLLRLNNGESLSESLAFMPKEFRLALQNGEISGEVAGTLRQLSQTYYQRYEEKLAQWTKFVEPLCLTTIAVFVFLLVMAVFSPLMQLFDSINLD